MPKLYFFSLVCFEFYKEHTIVQSIKWIGKDCGSHAWAIATRTICNYYPTWICNFLHDCSSNLLPFKLKKPCWNRTKEQIS